MGVEKTTEKREGDSTHIWHPVCDINMANVDLCRKCGILRLKTYSSSFYFVQVSGTPPLCHATSEVPE